MKKKLLALCLGVILALTAFSGCGSDEAAETGSETDLLTQAMENCQNVNSMTYDMAIDTSMSISAQGESQAIDMKMTANIEFINDPMAMYMSMTTDMGELGSQTSDGYGEVVDDDFILYTQVGDVWYKQTVGDAETMMQYNGANSMTMYMESVDNFTAAGTEDINGSEATKYTGVVTGDDLQEVINNTAGLSDQLTSLGMDAETVATLYSDAGDLEVTIWIDNATAMPVKYEMDMSAMMQSILSQLLGDTEDVSFDISKMLVNVTATGYDNVDAIEIPEEARNGQDISASLDDAAE